MFFTMMGKDVVWKEISERTLRKSDLLNTLISFAKKKKHLNQIKASYLKGDVQMRLLAQRQRTKLASQRKPFAFVAAPRVRS